MKTNLVTVREHSLYTTSVIIARQLKSGNKNTDKFIHRDINRVIETLLSTDTRFTDQIPQLRALQEELGRHPTPRLNPTTSGFTYIIEGATKKPKGMKLQEDKVYRTLTNNRGEEYNLIAYKGGNNKLALTWSMNEKAFIRVIMRLSGYKNADRMQSDIIDAFFMMRDIVKKQPQPKFKEVEVENFGKISMANRLHGRTEEIRGYFRSNKNKELSRLYGERTRLQNRLGGLMDLEILKEIALIDRRIETAFKTPIQEELSNNIKSTIELKIQKDKR